MEEYNTNSSNNHHLSENTGPTSNTRPSFLYSSTTTTSSTTSASSSLLGGVFGRSINNHNQNQVPNINTFHLQSSGGASGSDHNHNHQFHSDQVHQNHPLVKTEAITSSQNHHHHLHQIHTPILQNYPLLRGNLQNSSSMNHPHHSQIHQQGGNHQSSSSSLEVEAIKAKIIAHPQYSNLLEAYMDCQKVGAPPEVVARMVAARQELEAQQRSSVSSLRESSNKDPELDQFMEAYYDMLVKYREEITRPIQEAMDFMRRVETQLNMLCNGPLKIFSDDKGEGVGSSADDQDNSGIGVETDLPEIDPRAEDRELKNHLLRKYSGYLSSLKQELSKKKKKGKLPKEARQKLLNWWELHYKWPYPSESEKVALAESTGLDQKQINNWFINQRKRHWKPSEDMQFMVMDGLHAQNAATLYMDGHYLADPHYRLGP